MTSAQQGACNAAMYGAGKYVLNVGNQFAYEIISNNLIKIQDGYAINQGRLMGIDSTLYEEMIIDNGLQGVKRVDLICMKYTQNADTGVENVEMVVVKGTSGDTYADPSTVSGDILAGAVEDDFPLYRVKIDGINITAVEPLFNIMVSAQELVDKIGTTDISSIGDGSATGAISAINNNLKNQHLYEHRLFTKSVLVNFTDGKATVDLEITPLNTTQILMIPTVDTTIATRPVVVYAGANTVELTAYTNGGSLVSGTYWISLWGYLVY